VVGHSAGERMGGYDAEALADKLLARGMESEMAIRLVGCFSGTDVDQSTHRVARALALELERRGKTNIAVKGALGVLIKTRRKPKGEEEKKEPSGVYTGVTFRLQGRLVQRAARAHEQARQGPGRPIGPHPRR
jgi:hypothetical protein